MNLKLYGYWRSSATYRVRIALNLKGLEYEYVPVHLVREGGQQHSPDYQGLNPAELVPTLVDEDEDLILNQSMSIVEFINERYPEPFPLLPEHASDKARVRGLAQDIACDIQPLANLRVLNRLREQFDAGDEAVRIWAANWIEKGFSGIEKRLQTQAGKYCFDFNVTLADVCLVPQVYNAIRFGVNMEQFPLINRIWHHCEELEAFARARPENQPDAQ
ncbi:maleylacetoacetate isomerase [Alteromonas aestuariivivens]|uniref:Maleylacetoacetate isomerase n=1 Tax=Alteromonas aestuariivivens TaxID=1938339 RepID=A0A3D8M6E9_9ALTE|nr:maleylacetoacetate isomerase [Alteromonas aestuariivivens]RDV25125.1 maleylacetoacetate isomerase [Alteromonas aestuariivivens]